MKPTNKSTNTRQARQVSNRVRDALHRVPQISSQEMGRRGTRPYHSRWRWLIAAGVLAGAVLTAVVISRHSASHGLGEQQATGSLPGSQFGSTVPNKSQPS